MSKIGIVFSGGGGKGAYEIGVWKALTEYGISKSITAVAGTSVGSLNGALFSVGDYERAEKTWCEIAPHKVLGVQERFEDSILNFIVKAGFSAAQPFLEKALSSLIKSMQMHGFFDDKALRQLIEESVDLDALSASSIPFHVCTYNLTDARLEYIKMNGLSKEEMVFWLLSSAAIPVVFPNQKKNGKEYIDGGLPLIGDNCPIGKVVDQGCDMVIAISLDRGAMVSDYRSLYPNTRICQIVPSQDTGGLVSGTLNFNPDNAQKLLKLGYDDTCRILKDLYELMLSEQGLLEKTGQIEAQHHGFSSLIQDFAPLRELATKRGVQCISGARSLEVLLELSGPDSVMKIQEDQTFEDSMKALDVIIEQGERAILDEKIDLWIDSFKDNSKALLEHAFDAFTNIATADNKAHGLYDQDFFTSVMGTVSGKTRKMQAEVAMDQNRALYATAKMVHKLAERGSLQLDAILVLGNKVTYQMAHINKLYGMAAQQYQHIAWLKNIMGSLAKQTELRFKSMQAQVDDTVMRVQLLEWERTLKERYINKTPVEILCSVCNGYYRLTEGVYDQISSLRLFSILADAGIPLNQTVDIGSFFDSLCKEPQRSVLFEGLGSDRFFPLKSEFRKHFVLLAGLENNLEHPEGNQNIAQSTSLSYRSLASELFFSMRMADHTIDARTGIKKIDLRQTWLANLGNIMQAIKEAGLAEQYVEKIVGLKKNIEGFVVTIPLVGLFSAGKSRLLNAVLGIDLLGWDTLPKTSIPTELRWGTVERIVGIDREGKETVLDRAFLENIDSAIQRPALIKVELPVAKLANRKDLVIVDMPGLDSNQEDHTNAILEYLDRGHHFILVVQRNSAYDAHNMDFLLESCSLGQSVSAIITHAAESPQENEEVRAELRRIMSEKFGTDCFVGLCESGKRDRDTVDFEHIIDDVYGRRSDILETRYGQLMKKLKDDLAKDFERLLSTTNETAEALAEELEALENTVVELHRELGKKTEDLQRRMAGENLQRIVAQVQSALESNVGSLTDAVMSVQSALNATVLSIVRPVIITTLREAVQREVRKISQSLEVQIDSSLPQLQIGQITLKDGFFTSIFGTNGLTKFLDSIIGFFTGGNTKDADVRNQIENNVIPQVVNQVQSTLEVTLVNLAREISIVFTTEIDERKKEIVATLGEKQKALAMNEQEYQQKKERWKKAQNLIFGGVNPNE